MRDGVSWLSLLTFQFAMPLMRCAYARDEKMTVEQFGELPKSVDLDGTVTELEAAWKREYSKDP